MSLAGQLDQRTRRQLVEAAAHSEYDWDALRTGEASYDWNIETELVKAIYIDRARRWFGPVFRHFDG